MKLRTQILLFLSLFAIIPLLFAVFINVPLVLDRMELFYHKAYLQNLRADFRDLDQYLASRNELLQMITKLPEPAAMWYLPIEEKKLKTARIGYAKWINRMLNEQHDIIELLFISHQKKEVFSLTRNQQTGLFEEQSIPPVEPMPTMLEDAFMMQQSGILVSPIRIQAQQADYRKVMTLQLFSPIFLATNKPLSGVAIMTIDVGGIARAFPKSIWVHQNGQYIDSQHQKNNAFDVFTGLEQIFKQKKPALWEDENGQQLMWVPILQTEKSGPLWVGREVDSSPIAKFRGEIIQRVLLVIAFIAIILLLLSRWLAQRIEQFNNELTQGIENMLKEKEVVSFHWQKPLELKKLARNLNRLSKEHQEKSQQVRQHAKTLEATNRYKSEFLANVSHELRTPLNSILLLSKLLKKEKKLSEECRQQANIIHTAGQDLLDLINNVLDLSRLEAGKTVLHIEEINLRSLMTDIISLIEPQYRQKDINLDLIMNEHLPIIYSDPVKIRQIVNNFLSNALKFTEKGQVQINIKEESSYIFIAVKDQGIGIEKEKQQLIFNAFQQADGSTSRRYGGTGLGLNISHQFTKMLGGKILLESKPNHGSTFTLVLPLQFNIKNIDHQKIELTTPPVITEQKETLNADFAQKKILIISEKLNDLLILTPLLNKWNIDVHAAGEAEEAAETLLQEKNIDGFIVDIDLSSGDDCANISLLTNQGVNTQKIMLLLSENEIQQIKTNKVCKKYDLTAILMRPFNEKQLLEQLQQLLK